MKRLAWIAITLLITLTPTAVAAHGGVEQNTVNAVVKLYQTPLSPLMYEQVESAFVFSNRNDERLANLPVKLTLIDTFHGDESKDKIMLTRDLTTDANGFIYFSYRYPKANAYDIDLDFEIAGKQQEAGFLLQVRNPLASWFMLVYAPILLIGIGLGVILRRAKKVEKTL